MVSRARDAYARIEGRVAPFYGLAAALAMAVPLVAGSLTGNAAQGAMVALGAYLVALRAPEGPYGAQARNLGQAVLVIGAGAMIGGNLGGFTWLAVAVIPPVVALGSAVPWIGPTAGLAVLLTAVRPPVGDVVYGGALELVGGVLAMVLLLVPWPVRRLRPLRTALGEAAEAVAAALDAVAEDIGAPDDDPLRDVEFDDARLADVAHKPDWEQRRRAASQALTTARATYALYSTGRGRSEPTRPQRLIDALSRIMQETVALRTLVEAAGRRPAHREWQGEGHVAITALAARVRLLAGAVRTSDELPLGSPDSAAIRRFGRRAEAVRRAGLAGDEDLLAVALVVQIRRTVDRMAGGIDSARRVVAGGIRIGFGPPRLPETGPDAPTPWGRIRSAIRTRSPGFREVTRIFLVAAVAMALGAALRLDHGHWLTLTAMLSLRGTYGQTVDHVLQRVGGTAIGSAIAALLLTLAPGQLTTALVIFVFALVGFALRSVNFTFWGLFGTPLAMMLLDFSVQSDWVAAAQRIGLTLAGGALAFLAVWLLWPTGHAERLPVRAGRLLGVHARLVRSTAEVLVGERERLPYQELADAERAAERLASDRDALEHERRPDTGRIERLGAAADTAHHIRDHLIAIARMSREDVEAGPLPEILDRLADQLEDAADSLDDAADSLDEPTAAGDAPSPAEKLDEEFEELDLHLSALARRRRAEIGGGVSPDESTPLRHAVLQVSGTRYAVRSLRSDVDALIAACREAVAVQK